VTPTARSQSIWNVYQESTSLSQKQFLGTALILANRKTSMALLRILFQSANLKSTYIDRSIIMLALNLPMAIPAMSE
jgi:hypothetical protein